MQDTRRRTELLTNNTTTIHPLKLHDSLALNQEEKVKLFASTLHKIFTRNADILRLRRRMLVTFWANSTRPVRDTNRHEKGRRQDTSNYAQQPPLPALDLSGTIYNTRISIMCQQCAQLSKSLCSQNCDRTSPQTNQFVRFFCQALLRTITKIFNSTLKELNLVTDGKHGFKHGQCTIHAPLPLSERTTDVFHNNKATLASFWTHRRVYANYRWPGSYRYL
jgi:Mg2+ and Co2+ transporter CorA